MNKYEWDLLPTPQDIQRLELRMGLQCSLVMLPTIYLDPALCPWRNETLSTFF